MGSALHVAVSKNHVLAVATLLRNGADRSVANAMTRYAVTPAQLALNLGNKELASYIDEFSISRVTAGAAAGAGSAVSRLESSRSAASDMAASGRGGV